jgi:hypothetical protein
MYTTYNFPTHKKGDTMREVVFTVTVNAVALNLTGASIRMDLRSQEKALLQRFTTHATIDPGLTITNATAGQFKFNQQTVDVKAGTHDYDIEFALADGTIVTYITGTWTITQDVTYD